MPRAFTEQERTVIGRRLLQQGYRLFSTYGLAKTNVEEIAKAAGISKGAFYLFYEFKEALFMDVIEEAEVRVRQELLAVIALPGPSPRLRLLAVLKKAFDLFESIPILKFFSGGDYDVLFRRVPPQKIQEHLAADRQFIDELIVRCRDTGIPIQAKAEQITGLLYTLVLAIMHQDDLLQSNFGGSVDLYLELVAAFCLGEVQLQSPKRSRLAAKKKGK